MTTALYRRYRPQTFAEVIGQDHVVAPLRQALRTGQASHAYLFSGPRGCGKTTSARILARVLNCAANTADHPGDTPCGVCESCVELATGGPGSLDVVEIDAASHGGVDDTRELRERATFAPARDRFKIFILDEAHMVSSAGFNALLKIVEEPPPHVKFVFATTEPDKVIGTIRSRTHHYPFRLVPPDVLTPYLQQVCDAEGVAVHPGVLPLVVRAGGGSVRDSLSVLDQLVAGAGTDGLRYEPAVALLGFTPESLLDDLVESLAARDAAACFRVVERVIDAGHEPRRFVEDLLTRWRDLILVAAAGDAATAVLRDLPPDALDRRRTQAGHLGAAELSRAGDLTSAALTEMVGATSPRLQLELLVARLLLPSADDGTAGLGARLDRLERTVAGGASGGRVFAPTAPPEPPTRVGSATAPVEPPAQVGSATARSVPVTADREPAAAPLPAPAERAPSTRADESRPDPRSSAGSAVPMVDGPAAVDQVELVRPDGTSPTSPPPSTASSSTASRSDPPIGPAPTSPVQTDPPPTDPAPTSPALTPATTPSSPGVVALDTEVLRQRWPEVLETIRSLRRYTLALVAENALPLSLDETTLRLGFRLPGHVSAFETGHHAEVVAHALHETLGVTAQVLGVLVDAGPGPSVEPEPDQSPMPSREQAEASWAQPGDARPVPSRGPAGQQARGGGPGPESRRPGPAGGHTNDLPAGDDGGPLSSRAAHGRATDRGVDPPDEEPHPAGPDADGPDPDRRDLDRSDLARPDQAGRRAGEPSGVPATGRAERRPRVVREPEPPAEPDEPSPDDRDLAGSGLVGAPLVAQMLGGRVIDEQIENPDR